MQIKGWKKFQHFKDRKPPWVKLYRDILDDMEWYQLPGESAKMLIMLWLIASENDGVLPDIKMISFRLRQNISTVADSISYLTHWIEDIDKELAKISNKSTVLQDDIEVISIGYQGDSVETEIEAYKEEGEKEKKPLPEYSGDFLSFWKMYPRKEAKAKAWQSWQKAKVTFDEIQPTLSWQIQLTDWTKSNGEFVPHPATYLNQKRWQDEKADTSTTTTDYEFEDWNANRVKMGFKPLTLQEYQNFKNKQTVAA